MKGTIVVCEDDESILEVLQMILEDQGYDVRAWSYCDSIEPIRVVKPDLLLVDLWFPELGGEELCRQTKADPAMSHVPVILVSASNDLPQVAENVRADAYISKPFDVQDVVAQVEDFLNK